MNICDDDYINQLHYKNRSKGYVSSTGQTILNTSSQRPGISNSRKNSATHDKLSIKGATNYRKPSIPITTKRVSIASIANKSNTSTCCSCLFDNQKNDFFRSSHRKSIMSLKGSDLNIKMNKPKVKNSKIL